MEAPSIRLRRTQGRRYVAKEERIPPRFRPFDKLGAGSFGMTVGRRSHPRGRGGRNAQNVAPGFPPECKPAAGGRE